MIKKEVKTLLRARFSGVTDEKFEKAIVVTAKSIKPKTTKEEIENTGSYNTIALQEFPYDVLEVKDQDKENLSWKLNGQQVCCDRNLQQPITVTYVSAEKQKEWFGYFEKKMDTVLKEL